MRYDHQYYSVLIYMIVSRFFFKKNVSSTVVFMKTMALKLFYTCSNNIICAPGQPWRCADKLTKHNVLQGSYIERAIMAVQVVSGFQYRICKCFYCV